MLVGRFDSTKVCYSESKKKNVCGEFSKKIAGFCFIILPSFFSTKNVPKCFHSEIFFLALIYISIDLYNYIASSFSLAKPVTTLLDSMMKIEVRSVGTYTYFVRTEMVGLGITEGISAITFHHCNFCCWQLSGKIATALMRLFPCSANSLPAHNYMCIYC